MQFENWAEWSPCSKSCGGGIKTRVRSCLSAICIGHSKEYLDCNTDPCLTSKSKATKIQCINRSCLIYLKKVDDEWGPWTECKRIL